MLVVVFGLFHGVIFLPVILSIIGPQPYETSKLTNGKIMTLQQKYNGDGDIAEMMNLQHKNGTLNGVEKN